VRRRRVRPAASSYHGAVGITGKLVHSGSANRTPDEWRPAVHTSFCEGWLRQGVGQA
jgi:ectoine hydroxylase-related dioxygenase (phytanoyl-CoA dioxygenase family)